MFVSSSTINSQVNLSIDNIIATVNGQQLTGTSVLKFSRLTSIGFHGKCVFMGNKGSVIDAVDSTLSF